MRWCIFSVRERWRGKGGSCEGHDRADVEKAGEWVLRNVRSTLRYGTRRTFSFVFFLLPSNKTRKSAGTGPTEWRRMALLHLSTSARAWKRFVCASISPVREIGLAHIDIIIFVN